MASNDLVIRVDKGNDDLPSADLTSIFLINLSLPLCYYIMIV